MFGIVPFIRNSVRTTGDTFEDFVSKFFDYDFFNNVSDIVGSNSSNIIGDFITDIKETSNEYILQSNLPGVNKEDIILEYRNNYLILSAKRNEFINEDNNNCIIRKKQYGEFSKCFYLNNVDKNKIKAAFDNGKLTVTLPKINKIIDSSSKIEIQ